MYNSSSWVAIFLAMLLSSPFFTNINCINDGPLISVTEGRVNCQEDGFFPSDNLCTGNYVICVGGVGYPEVCPSNTIFDPQSLACVPLNEASCLATSSSSTELTTESSTERRTSTTSSTSTSPVTDTTTPGTTSTSMVTPTRATRPTTACPTCPWECPDSNGFYAIPYYCGPDYFVCVEGSPYVLVCPNETYFDPETLLCTDIPSVSCIFRCPSPDGRFPVVPGECNNSFYDCIDNVPYPDKCPGNSIFDPQQLICVPANSGFC